MNSDRTQDGTRLTEAGLTAGLARFYQRGYLAVLVLMTTALLHPVTGWRAIDDLAMIGLILLAAVPLTAVLKVGFTALREGDRSLLLIVLGIIGLLAVAAILPSLLSRGG